MTTKVVAVDRITSYKEIARLLSENKISAVPVLIMGRHVVGVVSEADLLAAQDQAARRARSGRTVLPWRAARHPKLTAEQLMTRPAITIHPDAPIARAAALMHTHHVKRLPVVDPQGKLTGIVSRRDLLSVFLRPDAQIAAEVRELLKEILFADPETISVAVHGGVVTLRGQPGPQDHHDLIPVALRLIWDIDGVIDVVNKISTEAAPPAAPSAPGDAADAEETYTKRGQGGEAVAGSRVGAAGCSPGAPCARLRAYRLVRRPHQPRGHGNVDRACGCGPTSNDLATRVHGRAPAFGEGESSEGT